MIRNRIMENQKIKITKILFIALTLFLFVSPVAASNIKTAIIYPDAIQPYANLFSTIINGLQSDTRINTLLYKHDNEGSANELSSWLNKDKPDVVIALGQTSNDLVAGLNLSIPVITSAVTQPDKRHGCVCLNIEPHQLVAKLLELNPDIKRIIYVYDSNNNSWFIPVAKSVAKKAGIKLVLKSANSVQEAALHYKEILNSKLGPTDAIWLPLDNSIPGDVILPELLKAAWQKKFIIFSSNPFYVKRGGLFALFPDYFALGKQLASTSIRVMNNKNKLVQENALSAKSAINIRMARHLGLSISRRQLNQYDIIYPHR